ncbi:4-coumarate--CoA ligase 1-like [Zerene cesonia]|uniref:4-coumarate--CoA ligase 1-like n=1 Tax=Zerene cesonia TaxID=33412 RepID=UPI0018E4EFA3|nr:4-coumarate--CoA ligase 1-like [Zerene cesonia]
MFKNPKYMYGASTRSIYITLNFGEFVLKKLVEFENEVALINGLTDEKLFYGEIAQEAMNIAVSLIRFGVKKGDVIAISSENRREFWSTLIGIICAGAIATTINLSYSKDELTHVMNIAKPKFIFASPFSYKQHSKNYKSLKFLEKIILYGDENQPNTLSYNDIAKPVSAHTGTGFENVRYDDFQCVEVAGQIDTAFILYSSGTTGLPKGVMITHLNLLAACTPPFEMPPQRSLSITPWFHSMGLISTLSGFLRGKLTIYLPKFDVDTYFKTVEKYQISQLSVVPAMLTALSKAQGKYDTSSVVEIYSGAAPLYEETAISCKKMFPNVVAILQGYGLTECTLALTFNMNFDKMGSVGNVVENVILKVVNPETREALGPNQEGEICAKGLVVMKGYLNKDRRDDFDDEGFFRTGDLGYYDDEGCFYIVDRLKELIKFKGYQVPPAEIEAVLLQHNGIREAAVVGLPDLAAGELPLAFVVLQPGAKLSEKEIQDYVAERLSNPKHLRGGVRFINEIPKNPTGKILRKELRKMVGAVKSKI